MQQNDGNDVQDVIENNAQQTESETFDYDAYIDELEHFKEHPINLNKANATELDDLPLLNAQQISSLLDYIAEFGWWVLNRNRARLAIRKWKSIFRIVQCNRTGRFAFA